MREEDRLWIQRSSVGSHLLLVAVVLAFPLTIIPIETPRMNLEDRTSLGVGFAVMFAGWGLWGLRRVAVLAYPDHVVVRNIGETHRLRRSRIEGVEIGPSDGYERGTYVWIRVRGGDLWRVDALSTPLEGPRGMRVAAERSARLREWVDAPRP